MARPLASAPFGLYHGNHLKDNMKYFNVKWKFHCFDTCYETVVLAQDKEHAKLSIRYGDSGNYKVFLKVTLVDENAPKEEYQVF